MTAVVWEARARSGEVKKGVMDAEDAESVEDRLKQQMLVTVSVHKQPRELPLPFGPGVKTTDVVVFPRMFATMIPPRLPIVQCLALLSARSATPRF